MFSLLNHEKSSKLTNSEESDGMSNLASSQNSIWHSVSAPSETFQRCWKTADNLV